jgi:hypothetical protein
VAAGGHKESKASDSAASSTAWSDSQLLSWLDCYYRFLPPARVFAALLGRSGGLAHSASCVSALVRLHEQALPASCGEAVAAAGLEKLLSAPPPQSQSSATGLAALLADQPDKAAQDALALLKRQAAAEPLLAPRFVPALLQRIPNVRDPSCALVINVGSDSLAPLCG